MPKKKNLDLGSARAPDFGEAIFLFFLNGMVLTYAKKIYNKIFRARARTRLENRTDPNPLITGRSPNWTPKVEPKAMRTTTTTLLASG